MAGTSCSPSADKIYEMPTVSPRTSRSSGDSTGSWFSSFSSTLDDSNSLLSCSESELSVRTGSTAFQRLPPRPVPPPPLPKKQASIVRKSPPKTPSPVGDKPSPPTPLPFVTKCPSPPSVKRTAGHRSLSLSKKPFLKRTSSLLGAQAFSLPKNPIARTFSSDVLQHMLYSLPPAYPPPPPPNSQPAPSHQPFLQFPPSPPNTTETPLSRSPSVPQTPPLQMAARRERRYTLTETVKTTDPLMVPFEQHENDKGWDTAKTNTCHSSVNKQSLVAMACISMILSLACCFLVAAHFVYFTYERQGLQICLPVKYFNSSSHSELLEKLVIDDRGQYCAVTNDGLSHLLQEVFLPLKNFRDTTSGRLRISLEGDCSTGLSQFRASGVSVTNGGLKIRHSGLYFMYFSMLIKPVHDTDTHRHWNHSIVVERGSRTITAMENSHTCVNGFCSNQHTAYTGGVFQLEEDDIVYASINQTDSTSYNCQTSYLGLIRIGHSQ